MGHHVFCELPSGWRRVLRELLCLMELHRNFMLAFGSIAALLQGAVLDLPRVTLLGKCDCVRLHFGCYPEGTRGRGCFLDERLKELMQELGNAINESLSDSDRIAAAIGEIKRAGYDVFLVLEATIGFNKREESDSDEDESATSDESQNVSPRANASGKIKLTTQDQKFLRALKIQIDEDSK